MQQDGLQLDWCGPTESVVFDDAASVLRTPERPCYVVRLGTRVGVTCEGRLCPAGEGAGSALALIPPLTPQQLGDPAFRATYGLRYAYMAGSMANAIASEAMVIALGQAGMLGAFGAGGLPPRRLEEAIRRIQAALPQGPYAFNLIHSPLEPALEREAVRLYLKHKVRVIEASAYLRLTPYVVHYRAAGLTTDAQGRVVIQNRVIAKVSRQEVAAHFMRPAPERLLRQLVAEGAITERQAALAAQVPMADDVTVEGDSGGHTDNRPLVVMLPAILALRDAVQAEYRYAQPVRVGAAGGIGTPEAALGALMMGAAYIVTGSINQSCVEAGTSAHVKALLAQASPTDVMMAPAADMFEMGAQVQVLKRGTMFPLRAKRLADLYARHRSLDEIPPEERAQLERKVFQQSLDEVWAACVDFFRERDPSQLEKAARDPRRKMALVFRWYLGLAARWATQGTPGREMDYQIWCGPAMGAFNARVQGTPLASPENRRVADVGRWLMEEAALLWRRHLLRASLQGESGSPLPPTGDAPGQPGG